MTIFHRAFFIGISMLLANIASAQAGDLLMPRAGGMKDAVPAYVDAMPSHRRTYVRGDIAYAFHDNPDIIEGAGTFMVNEEYDDTWTVGVGVGRYFSANIRGDITVDYRIKTEMSAYSPDQGGAGCCTGLLENTTRKFDVSNLVVLANLYYDFASYYGGGYKDGGSFRSRFTPYIGVGLGFVTHWSDDGTVIDCGCTGLIGDNSETGVAAAFMAGVGINVRQHMKVDAGYRYLYMAGFETGDVTGATLANNAGTLKVEDIHAHEFRVGLRYDFR